MALESEELEQLEELIDGNGLEDVIKGLSDICYEKADHLRSNWQDENAAKSWERDARTIDKIVMKIEN